MTLSPSRQPRFSVVTVTYLDPKGLAQSIQSLVPLQRLFPGQWEHLVVDSSPEASAPALSKVNSGWPLNHMSVPAEGIYRAMNAGWKAALGEVIWFLNGGDTLLNPESLVRRVEELQARTELDMICAGCELTKNGEVLYPRRPQKTLLESLIRRNEISHQGVLYKASILGKVGEFDPSFRIAADYEHHFRCYLAGARALCVSDLIAQCDMGGTSNVKWKESLQEAKRVSEKWKRELKPEIYARHQRNMRWEYFRVLAVKSLGALKIRYLEDIWRRFHRREPKSQTL